MIEKTSNIKLDNLFYTEKPSNKKKDNSFSKIIGLSIASLFLACSFSYLSPESLKTDTNISSLHTLAETHRLENESRNLIHSIFTHNKDNYRNNFYKLKGNPLLSIEGYNNILNNINDTGFLNKINTGVEIVSLDDVENPPYLYSVSYQDKKHEMVFIVPVILVENNHGILTKYNKKYSLTFRLINNQYLVTNLTMLP